MAEEQQGGDQGGKPDTSGPPPPDISTDINWGIKGDDPAGIETRED